MNKQTFCELWNHSAKKWISDGVISVENSKTEIKSLCYLVDGVESKIYNNYETIKRIVKDYYFKESDDITINRYKRAAVIVQAVLLTNPLRYKLPELKGIDYYLLKQRLAFYVAVKSIIYSYEEVNIPGSNVFDFGKLDANLREGEDDFLTSVYKDLFYAELYNNYNVLTMANIFGLLTETSSVLPNYNLKGTQKTN